MTRASSRSKDSTPPEVCAVDLSPTSPAIAVGACRAARSEVASVAAVRSNLPGMITALSSEDVAGIVVWTFATAVTGCALARAPRDRRLTWAVVVAACVVIVADNALGVQDIAMTWGKAVVHALDLDVRNTGSVVKRSAFFAALFLGGSAALFALVRADRPLDGPRRLSLAGLVCVMAFLGARMTPGLRSVLHETDVAYAAKAVCWMLVVGGAVWSLRRMRPRER